MTFADFIKRWPRYALWPLIVGLVLIVAGIFLVNGATTYPRLSQTYPVTECKAWYGGDELASQLAARTAASGAKRPEHDFCLGVTKLGQDTAAAVLEINKAVADGYIPAMEWLAREYSLGLYLAHDESKSQSAWRYADAYGSALAREVLYAFGLSGWERNVVFFFGFLAVALGAACLSRRAAGFDLRILGPAFLAQSVMGMSMLKADPVLAVGGNVETLITFVVAALGANLTAALFVHSKPIE